ncbi:tetratricopeptide repeat protein [Bacillaceae bacterium S4-13-58]
MSAANEVFNIEEHIKDFVTEENKEEINVIVEEFKRGHFLNVLNKTKRFREGHEVDKPLERILLLLDATCHSQLGEGKRGAEIIMDLYKESEKNRQVPVTTTIDDLLLYGNIAFMNDYKLARRILSDAVNQIEKQEDFDPMKAASTYLILGEAEEQLEKLVRATRYFEQGLAYFQKANEVDKHLIAFLHFKLGTLHSSLNKIDEAIKHLQKAMELAGELNNIEMKINSMVSLGRMYGTKKEYDKAGSYLKEALPLLEGSTLENKIAHAEAYTELAYNCFDQSQLDEAVPYYEKAINIHLNLPRYSSRELGMILMQYAYCLEHKENPDKTAAGKNYEKAIEELEKTNDDELLENALADIIAFFESTKNGKKKRFYENKFVKLTNDRMNKI